MSKSVIILCLNGRRRTIKFPPNHTVAQIIEDLCTKEKLDASSYDLRTSKSVVDRTLPWRYTNLPNNAKLELCPRDVCEKNEVINVKIALQLQNGKRLTGDFPTSTLLSDILVHFSDQLKSLLQSEVDGTPTIIYMRQNLVGNKMLSSTSLAVLGIIKGSALLRLTYQSEKDAPANNVEVLQSAEDTIATLTKGEDEDQKTVKSFHREEMEISASESCAEVVSSLEATAEVAADESIVKTSTESLETFSVMGNGQEGSSSQAIGRKEQTKDLLLGSKGDKIATTSAKWPKVETNEVSSNTAQVKSAQPNDFTSNQVDLSSFKFPDETKGANLLGQHTAVDETELNQECPRRPMLFNERTKAESNRVASEVSDEFFQVTVDDLRKMMADLKHERKKFEEKEMLTEDQRKTKKLHLASKYPNVIIRIIFPDQLVLQGVFRPLEKMKRLYEFVQEHTAVKTFCLFTSPPKQMLTDKEVSLLDNNLAPAARVYFGANNANDTILRESTLSLLCTYEDANKELLKIKNESAKR